MWPARCRFIAVPVHTIFKQGFFAMPSVSQAVTIVHQRTGIAPAVVNQAARRLQEDKVLPQGCGAKPAQVGAEHVALLLFAAMTTPTANASTRQALNYAGLTFEGGAMDGDGPGTTLLRHFSKLIEHEWLNKEKPRLEFNSLTLNLMTPGATMQTMLNDLAMHATFVPRDTDANEFRAQTIRREVTLSRVIFSNIVADLRKLDDGKRRKAAPFHFTIH
jgi:hypothetical protein